jgi:hypothetical protein
MKRAREEDDYEGADLEEELQHITKLVSSVKKRLKKGGGGGGGGIKKQETDSQVLIQPPHSITSVQDEEEIKKGIFYAVGHIAEDNMIEITPMPSGVKNYSLFVEYPHALSSKDRVNIFNIPDMVQGGIEATSTPGKMKLTMVYCPDYKVAVHLSSQSIGERNMDLGPPPSEDTDGKLLHEIESFIPFVKDDVPKIVQNPYPYRNDLLQVIYMRKVESPVKFSQVNKIEKLNRIIEDISFIPAQDSNHVRIIIKYVKGIENKTQPSPSLQPFSAVPQ